MPLLASAAVHSKTVALLLMIHCLELLPLCVGWLCLALIVMHHLVSFLVLQSSRKVREYWLLYFSWPLDVMWL